ncbi:MAG TPA: CYTH domain-containing protein [Firmicutes bacterium]|nr:CYTH domain-containing protein [Bacillota bacterium]
MPRNVEIKVRLEAVSPYLARAEAISGSAAKIIPQEDIFFNCNSGRLKLRILSQNEGELIYYERPDQLGPKTSYYVISRTQDPNSLSKVLKQAYGVRAIVRKERRLFLSGRSRIHIDSVEDLGNFLELEVVLEEAEDPVSGEREAHDLMQALQVDKTNLIHQAYVDLLEANEG